MQQEAAGEGGRKWKRRRLKERGEASICPLMKTVFYVERKETVKVGMRNEF